MPQMHKIKYLELAISIMCAAFFTTVPNLTTAAIYECSFNPAASDKAAPRLVVVDVDKYGFDAKIIRIEIDDVETIPSRAQVKSFSKKHITIGWKGDRYKFLPSARRAPASYLRVDWYKRQFSLRIERRTMKARLLSESTGHRPNGRSRSGRCKIAG